MEGIYEVSSSDRVKRLQEDLTKELQELQNAIEENDFLKATPQSHKSFRCLNNCCLLILDFATRICSALQGAVREIQVLVWRLEASSQRTESRLVCEWVIYI